MENTIKVCVTWLVWDLVFFQRRTKDIWEGGPGVKGATESVVERLARSMNLLGDGSGIVGGGGTGAFSKLASYDHSSSLSSMEDLYSRSCRWASTYKGPGDTSGQLSATPWISFLKRGTSVCTSASATSPMMLLFFKLASLRHDRNVACARTPITSPSLK